MRELGSADERSDLSYIDQPSISEHPQNLDFHDWTALIDLTRDAWLALAGRSAEQARLVAQQWQQMTYPLFKRLAFFAATHEAIVPQSLALDWRAVRRGGMSARHRAAEGPHPDGRGGQRTADRCRTRRKELTWITGREDLLLVVSFSLVTFRRYRIRTVRTSRKGGLWGNTI